MADSNVSASTFGRSVYPSQKCHYTPTSRTIAGRADQARSSREPPERRSCASGGQACMIGSRTPAQRSRGHARAARLRDRLDTPIMHAMACRTTPRRWRGASASNPWHPQTQPRTRYVTGAHVGSCTAARFDRMDTQRAYGMVVGDTQVSRVQRGSGTPPAWRRCARHGRA